MKLSQSLENSELSKAVRAAVSDLVTTHVDEIVDKYDVQLRKDGRYLDPADAITLKKAIRQEKLSIKMTISSSITEKLLEDWNIYPLSKNQGSLQDFKPATEEVSQ